MRFIETLLAMIAGEKPRRMNMDTKSPTKLTVVAVGGEQAGKSSLLHLLATAVGVIGGTCTPTSVSGTYHETMDISVPDGALAPDSLNRFKSALGIGNSTAAQIDRLGQFILDHVPGEPSGDEGAVDVAIRLLRNVYQAQSAKRDPDDGKGTAMPADAPVEIGQHPDAAEEAQRRHRPEA